MMPVRPTTFRLLLCLATLSAGLTVGMAARAQLGSVNNPPPQNLFNFDGSPKPRNDGLGTMAERRRALAQSRTRHPVHRRTP